MRAMAGFLATGGIAFHPTKPSILAGGTYNGELQIWPGAWRSAKMDALVMSWNIFPLSPHYNLDSLLYIYNIIYIYVQYIYIYI